MRLRRSISARLAQGALGKRIANDQRYRILLSAAAGFVINLLYALYNGAVGMVTGSMWFLAMGAYYTVLSIMCFSAALCGWKGGAKSSAGMEYFVMRLSGGLLMVLSLILAGFVFASLSHNVAAGHDTILMITIAAYTFWKLAMAGMRAVRQRRENASPLLTVVRAIGYADAAASVLTLQMAMFASFSHSGHPPRVMNAVTGAAVCLFILALGGVTAARGIKRKDGFGMAKSKLVKANEKIAEKVVGAYKAIEETVVGGYKTVEETVVGGYAKVEDAFVERYLTKEGETVEEAKQRLRHENKD